MIPIHIMKSVSLNMICYILLGIAANWKWHIDCQYQDKECNIHRISCSEKNCNLVANAKRIVSKSMIYIMIENQVQDLLKRVLILWIVRII